MACRDFRLLDPAREQDEIDAKAAAIRRTYIGANAEQQVNLKGSVEAKVIRGLQQVPISKSVDARTAQGHRRLIQVRARAGGVPPPHSFLSPLAHSSYLFVFVSAACAAAWCLSTPRRRFLV
jgi:hypothetical protein